MIIIQPPADLGSALRKARHALGLTPPELALVAGVSVRFIMELEAGKLTVRWATAMRVVDALGGELRLTGLARPNAMDSSF